MGVELNIFLSEKIIGSNWLELLYNDIAFLVEGTARNIPSSNQSDNSETRHRGCYSLLN